MEAIMSFSKLQSVVSAVSGIFTGDVFRATGIRKMGLWLCLAWLIAGAAGPASAQSVAERFAEYAGDPISNAERYGTPRQLDLRQQQRELELRELDLRRRAVEEKAQQERSRLEAARKAAVEGLTVALVFDRKSFWEIDGVVPVGWKCTSKEPHQGVCLPGNGVAVQVHVMDGNPPYLYPIVDDAGEFRLPASYQGAKISVQVPVRIPPEARIRNYRPGRLESLNSSWTVLQPKKTIISEGHLFWYMHR